MAVTVSVSSTSSNPTHHFKLSAGGTDIGLIVKDFPKNMRTYPYSPSSLQFSTGRQGYGSFEPPYTSIDQTDWTGGLGQLRYKDASKFYDSYNMWTMTDGTLMPAPAWRFAQEMANTADAIPENSHMPSDPRLSAADTCKASHVNWQSLTGNERYWATQFTTDTNYSASDLWLFMRYFGTPGTLTAAVYTDDGSDNPNALVTNGSVALTAANITKAAPEGDMIGQLICFNFATAPSLTTGTKYWIVVYAAAGDNTTNYWEIAYSDIAAGSEYSSAYKDSSDGSSWATSLGPAFYRIHAAIKDAKLHFIEYKNALYACSEPLDGTAGKIYMNGYRGIATGTSTAAKLVDTVNTYGSNIYNQGTCHIWNGTGQGQYRKISTVLNNDINVDPDWDITPVQGGTDVGSEYVIIGTPVWRDVTPSGDNGVPGKPITDVLTLWGILYCAMGEEDELHRFREYNDNASPGVWTTFWGANSGTGTFGNENYIWRARNENPAEWTGLDQTSVSKAEDVNWGTDLTFGSGIPVGTRDHLITGLVQYNGKLWVGKEDGLWFIDFDGSYDRAYPLQIGLEAMSEPENCRTMFAKDLFLLFNWSNSLERLYGSTVDDIGPWRGAGMVERARGPIVDGIPVIGWMFVAVDGGPDGQSSILGYNGRGWHTLFRGPSRVLSAFSGDNDNPRIRSLHWQSIPGKDATNILWWEFGGQIMFMRFPRASLNPSQDSNMDFAPESYVVQSEMDAGYAELEKYFGKGRQVCNNTSGTLYMDYDTNANPFAFSWTNAGSSTSSNDPSHEHAIGDSRKRNIFVRTRISTANVAGTTPTRNNILQAIILDAFA
ncbi:MAG: choice-of-anchor R domain-containing protein, partial [Candidatus Thorarchaeota archaeon]